MIKFCQDFSDPEVLNLLMKKNLERKDNKRSLVLQQVQIGLTILPVAYLWLRSATFSVWYLIYFVLMLGMVIGCREQQVKGLRCTFESMNTGNDPKPEYTVNQNGILVHTNKEDTMMHWSHFVGWGTQGRILYLETNVHTFIVCHARQLSLEDFSAFKALAAQQISMQK